MEVTRGKSNIKILISYLTSKAKPHIREQTRDNKIEELLQVWIDPAVINDNTGHSCYQ